MANIILSKDDCLKQLYSRGNICLTASKMINIDAKYRPFLALFSDYTFLVNETAKTDRTLNEIILKFRVNYSTNYELNWQYVSSDFLKSVYLKAQDFYWYAPQYKYPYDLSIDEFKKMRCFLKSIGGLYCLSVTHLITPVWYRFFSPDEQKFALFDNGLLVVAENNPHSDELISNISQTYSQINIIKLVPEYFISAIYEQLLYTQLSARETYIELEKYRLEQTHQYTAEKALQILQSNSQQWKKLLLTDEKTARSMIYSYYARKLLLKS